MSDIKELISSGISGISDLLGGGKDTLGSGGANQAAQALGGRAMQLKRQECQAVGMDFDETSGQCIRRSADQPSLDRP